MEIQPIRVPTARTPSTADAPPPAGPAGPTAVPVLVPVLDELEAAGRAVQGWSVGPLVVEHARSAELDVNVVWLRVEQAKAAYVQPDPPT